MSARTTALAVAACLLLFAVGAARAVTIVIVAPDQCHVRIARDLKVITQCGGQCKQPMITLSKPDAKGVQTMTVTCPNLPNVSH